MKIDILSTLQYDVTGYGCYTRERKLDSVSLMAIRIFGL